MLVDSDRQSDPVWRRQAEPVAAWTDGSTGSWSVTGGCSASVSSIGGATGGGAKAAVGSGLIDADVESVRRHPIAPGAVRQGRQADVLTINETAQFARGVQFRRIGDIDGQTALGRRRGSRIPFPARIEDQGDHHGRDDRQAGTDGDENSIVLGHERLAGMRPPITLPGAPASTFFVARRPNL